MSGDPDALRALQIRKGTAGDSEAIARVYLDAYNVKTQEGAKEAYARELKTGRTFFIAYIQHQAIGFISWYMHGMPHHGLCELDRVAVVRQHRGCGIGNALFERMLFDVSQFYRAKGGKLRKIFLMTHDDNLRAQSFYKKMGMHKEAILKDHYYDGQDEAVYSLFVKGQ